MPLDFRKDKRFAHLQPEQLFMLYETEKVLREKILDTPREKRSEVFIWAYDELFRRCPWHPALTEKSGAENRPLIEKRVRQFKLILNSLRATSVLEIGCGNGELAIGLSENGFSCTGIDISTERIAKLRQEEKTNLEFTQTEGTILPFKEGRFDVAISMQLFEHLHPDDILLHLQEVSRCLKAKGYYLIETPNKYAGPFDVSRFFADKPEGFHLREYSLSDMKKLLQRSNFGLKKVILWHSRQIMILNGLVLESFWKILPKEIRRERSFGLHNPLYIAQRN